MAHRTNQKARRKRLEREAAKAGTSPPKPPFSARDLIDGKRAAAKTQRANFRKKFAEAPTKVRAAFRACGRKIREAHKLKQSGGAPKPIVLTLYEPRRSSPRLTETEIVWLLDLLAFQGWDVSLSKELGSAELPSLTFRLW